MATGRMPTKAPSSACGTSWFDSACGVGTATGISCSKVAPVFVTIWTTCASPRTQGKGMWIQAVESRPRSPGRILREGPVGVVDLHLRDRHRLGAAGAHQEVDAGVVEDAALEGQVLDRRRAVAEGAKRIGDDEPGRREAKEAGAGRSRARSRTRDHSSASALRRDDRCGPARSFMRRPPPRRTCPSSRAR